MSDRLTQQVVVRLTDEQSAALKKVAEFDERTVAQIVRFAIRQYLDAR